MYYSLEIHLCIRPLKGIAFMSLNYFYDVELMSVPTAVKY